MTAVFIIGLPLQLRARVEGVAKREKLYISSVLSDIGKKGTMQLLPDPADAVHKLKAYYEEFGSNFDDALVLVLPYASIPVEVDEELSILDELGGEVIYADQGEQGWPVLPEKTRPDTNFLNDVFRCVSAELFPVEEDRISQSFIDAAARNPGLLIVKGALDVCDSVSKLRFDFLRDSVKAFVEYLEKNGRVGRIDTFFRKFGVDHAQTGGIATTLEVTKNNKQVHKRTCNTHLKRGDATSPQGAARIYYQEFFVDGKCYVAILYAGPHPEHDIERKYILDS